MCELKLSCCEAAAEKGGVTPSRVCELKCYIAFRNGVYDVTPSRVCELKFSLFVIDITLVRHTLTGVY